MGAAAGDTLVPGVTGELVVPGAVGAAPAGGVSVGPVTGSGVATVGAMAGDCNAVVRDG